MPAPDATTRFSNRVDDYVRYRPGYPAGLIEFLTADEGLASGHRIADIGSGVGHSALPFLKNGNAVHGVEPNERMRQTAEQQLIEFNHFISVTGTAEATTLGDGSVDWVIAGQAFHWFDESAARTEFQRILKPGGKVALFWNTRRSAGSAFAEGYETLLKQFGTDYERFGHRQVNASKLERFFGRRPRGRTFPNEQQFDWESLRGRVLSASYIPAPGEPKHAAMMTSLRELFERTVKDGVVRMEYDCELWVCKLVE